MRCFRKDFDLSATRDNIALVKMYILADGLDLICSVIIEDAKEARQREDNGK